MPITITMQKIQTAIKNGYLITSVKPLMPKRTIRHPRVRGEVTLTRNAGAKAASVKANPSVGKGVAKPLSTIGEAPVPMSRPETYTMTPMDVEKIKAPTRLVRENKIEAGEEAYHKRAKAAVEAYYGIKLK